MRIIKATEAIPVEHPVFLIFGQPGIGKSSIGYSCREPLLLDYDKGAHRAANRGDTLVIDSWADVADLLEHRELIDGYQTVIKDTVGRCLDVLTADIAKHDPKKAPGGNLSQQGWGVLKNRFRQHIAALRSLGKDVLLIAHDKEDKDGETRIVRPDIVGGSYGEVMKVADFVGYVYMNGRDRVLDFNPTDRWVGKNPAGWAPFKVPPVHQAQAFMADLFDKGREALGAISEESAKAMRLIEDWQAKMAAFKTAEDFTRAMPEIKGLPLMLQAQLAPMLIGVAKTQGIGFDAARKTFMEPVAQTA